MRKYIVVALILMMTVTLMAEPIKIAIGNLDNKDRDSDYIVSAMLKRDLKSLFSDNEAYELMDIKKTDKEIAKASEKEFIYLGKEEKLEVAKKIGADFVINSKKENLNERLLEITDGAGPGVIIEAAGNPVTYLAAINDVSFRGRVVCIGYAKTDIAFATKLFVQKEMDILGSRNALQSDIQAVLNYLKRKTCPVDSLVSIVIEPEETGTALQKWADDPGKIMKILVKVS